MPKGGRTADILFPGNERRGPRDAGSSQRKEEEKGGVEALPALEEEEEDVEGGSGRVEGLLEKRENLHLPLKAPTSGAESKQQRSCSGSLFRDLGAEPLALDSQQTPNVPEVGAKTNFQSVHSPHEKTDALPRTQARDLHVQTHNSSSPRQSEP